MKKNKNTQPAFPTKIFAQASPCSVGGLSLFDAGARKKNASYSTAKAGTAINAENVADFFSDQKIIKRRRHN